MSNVIELKERRMAKNRLSMTNTQGLTEEQKAQRIDDARASLLTWLEARRKRLGQTARDVKESPEEVLKREQAKMQADQALYFDEWKKSTNMQVV